jgi:hypothetical protein
MDLRSSSEYRLLQVFVSENGVFEVYVNVADDERGFACTCPGWRARRECKHIAYVSKKVMEASGGYGITVKTGAAPLEDEVMDDAQRYRDWVIHNAKVETTE